MFQRISRSVQLNCSWFLQQRRSPGRRSHPDNLPRPPERPATDCQEHLPASQVCRCDQLPRNTFPASGMSPVKTADAAVPRCPCGTPTAGKLLWYSLTFSPCHKLKRCMSFLVYTWGPIRKQVYNVHILCSLLSAAIRV